MRRTTLLSSILPLATLLPVYAQTAPLRQVAGKVQLLARASQGRTPWGVVAAVGGTIFYFIGHSAVAGRGIVRFPASTTGANTVTIQEKGVGR